MPKGSNVKKGMRPGGRKAGTPNRRTTEAAEAARVQVQQSVQRGLKLGKDMLEDYMMAFHNLAVMYQPLPDGVPIPPGHQPDPEKFKDWGMLVVQTAKALADFQSPKFRAIQVMAPPPEQLPRPDGNVVTIDDPIAMARVYQRTMKQVR